MTQVNILFYSTYGHIYKMAEAVAEGARSVPGTTVNIYQVAETLSDDILEKMGATEAKKAFAHIPTATLAHLEEADALIFGTPTRYGIMAAQMKAFLDSTGGLWAKGTLIDKVGSVFTSTGTPHGGQEATILTFYPFLLHHGMIVTGVPFSEQRLTRVDEVTGGTPYGASTIAGPDGMRMPSENELEIAKTQGRRVAELAKKIKG